jgi:hypothetical protein
MEWGLVLDLAWATRRWSVEDWAQELVLELAME